MDRGIKSHKVQNFSVLFCFCVLFLFTVCRSFLPSRKFSFDFKNVLYFLVSRVNSYFDNSNTVKLENEAKMQGFYNHFDQGVRQLDANAKYTFRCWSKETTGFKLQYNILRQNVLFSEQPISKGPVATQACNV